MSVKVYEGCRLFLDNHDYVLCNVYMFHWESDLFAVSKSGYSIEIEVKVSRSDFLADFKKKKHNWMKDLRKGKIYFQHYQHDYESVKFNFCHVDWIKLEEQIPNRFYFACPEGLLLPEDIPPYAGLIYTDERYTDFQVVKKAPILHRFKKDFTKDLLSKYYHGSLNTKSRIAHLLYKINRNDICLADVQKELESLLRLSK